MPERTMTTPCTRCVKMELTGIACKGGATAHFYCTKYGLVATSVPDGKEQECFESDRKIDNEQES